jgi:hypothetical protein
MARGIITKKPVGGGAAGRLIVTEVVSDPTGKMAPLEPGKVVEFKLDQSPDIGSLVEFNIDPGTGMPPDLKPTGTRATVITGDAADINVGKGEYYFLDAAKVEGGIDVNGGVIIIANGSTVSGKISGVTMDSYILINGASTDGKVESSNGGYLSMDGCTTIGKISSTANKIAIVTNCNIMGKLEVLRAGQCFLSGNTVQGPTNTDCR